MYNIKFISEEDKQSFINSCFLIKNCVEEGLQKYVSNPFNQIKHEQLKCKSVEFYIDNYFDSGIKVIISGVFENDHKLYEYLHDYIKNKLNVYVLIEFDW